MRKYIIGGIAGAIAASSVTFVSVNEGRRFYPYYDQAHVLTVCNGHTGKDIELRPYTEYECNVLLRADLLVASEAINRLVTVPLSQTQYDAVLDLVFNIGVPSFERSTLLRKLNARDYKGASAEFPKWNKVRIKGVLTPNKGLLARRLREKAKFDA